MPEVSDPRTPILEAQLRGLHPSDELAYRWAYADHSAHCRRDPDWQARIEELKRQLDVYGLSRAFTKARELRQELSGKP